MMACPASPKADAHNGLSEERALKIYTRTEFMKLPAGTLYAKGKPWYFDGFHVKGDTIVHEGRAIDFGTRDLVCIESHDSGEMIDRLEAMRADGASFPMEDAYGRDGCFDDEDLFLVWEGPDLEEMHRVIDAAQSVLLS